MVHSLHHYFLQLPSTKSHHEISSLARANAVEDLLCWDWLASLETETATELCGRYKTLIIDHGSLAPFGLTPLPGAEPPDATQRAALIAAGCRYLDPPAQP